MKDKTMIKYFKACSQPQSNYAVEHFVDGSQFTPERRFRQSVIELEVASDTYLEIEYNLAKEKIKIKKLKGKLFNANKGTDSYDLLSLKVDRHIYKQEQTVRKLAGKRKEMDQHIQNLKQAEDELGFTEETTEEEIYKILQNAESEYYLIKLASDTAAHIISQRGGPSVGVSLALQQMPKCDIDMFQRTLQGMLSAISTNSYVPSLHGGGGIEDIMLNGDNAVADNTLKREE